jgi:phospholipid-binding lipoprotein MlaA
MMNSSFGIGGLFDVASRAGIEEHKEDFGQTLAVWGIGEGPYLMLPFLGPSSPRDAAGQGVDVALDPTVYIRI